MKPQITGRFAPSPTGPLHLGSLVAAIGSWLFARSQGGRWLVRLEDLDASRTVPGAATEILQALERYGLEWDGEPVYQSTRQQYYEEALAQLRAQRLVYDCCCSRAEVARSASAPSASDPIEATAPIYPGTCRSGLAAGRVARAVRLRVPRETISFRDAVFGEYREDLACRTGDFIVKRADGPFAYQFAVVVDDAAQGVTQVVRGTDLLSSTPRQIALQRALGLPTPAYAHLPLVLGAGGVKLSKRNAALPLPSLDQHRIAGTMALALRALGISQTTPDAPRRMLAEALAAFDPLQIPRDNVTLQMEATPSPGALL